MLPRAWNPGTQTHLQGVPGQSRQRGARGTCGPTSEHGQPPFSRVEGTVALTTGAQNHRAMVLNPEERARGSAERYSTRNLRRNRLDIRGGGGGGGGGGYRLQWRHVDFEARVVRVDPHTRRRTTKAALPRSPTPSNSSWRPPPTEPGRRGTKTASASASAPAFTQLRSTSVIRPRLDCPFSTRTDQVAAFHRSC